MVQTEKMASLGKLAAGVAHQLNNPLGGIILFTNLVLEEHDLDDSAREDLARVVRHYEASPYGRRILVYEVGGPNIEMFHDRYREKGPDYNPLNQECFRAWLSRKYAIATILGWHVDSQEVTARPAGLTCHT